MPGPSAGATDAGEPEADGDLPVEPAEAVAAAVPGYVVDDSVLAILREEAEREAQARRTADRPLESQPDLGIDAAMPDRARDGAQDGAQERAQASAMAEAEHAAGPRPSARRDLLPDVEEINDTLRPSDAGSGSGTAGALTPAAAEARGFRSGFLVVMTLAIIGAGVYATAPLVSSAVPALSGPLSVYVGGVDGLRLALDGLMRSATAAIDAE